MTEENSVKTEVRHYPGIGEVPANLTGEYISSLIKSQVISKLGKKTTICITTLTNDFELITSSACVDPNDYDQALGEKLVMKKACDKIWELEGYRKQCSDFWSTKECAEEVCVND